ncbi:hypothetical protein Moror_15950 [Moniliophthora roreri MCA 2997]|uniref:BTB domain-containing protein n=1 Tax=Moniliophthora roreri (strain MCA 2997) TaxID=1381753 RepID=V2XGC6_MONRO|nr:hypothetical protein Moror_15950 [Moniliophthora roreri MCA 2997]
MAEKPIDIDPHEMAKPLANSMALPVERSPSCPPPAAPAPIRHGRYYLDDSLAIFLVENHLFKVHRYFFRQESVFFDSMFDCPPPTEGQDGQTDDKPIEIPGVTCNQFEALLDHFYDGLFRKEAYFNSATPLQKYIDLLSVAHRFECTTARERAIKGIDTATTEPIQMIELAELYDVPRWIEPAYVELCQRKEPLNEAEVEALGPKKTVLVLRAREALHNSDEARRLLQESWCCSSYHSPLVSLPEKLLEKARVQRVVKGVLAPPAPVAPSPSIPTPIASRPSPFDGLFGSARNESTPSEGREDKSPGDLPPQSSSDRLYSSRGGKKTGRGRV